MMKPRSPETEKHSTTSGSVCTWASKSLGVRSECLTMLTDSSTWIWKPSFCELSNATLPSIRPASSSSRMRRQTEVRDSPERSARSIWLTVRSSCRAFNSL